MLRNLALLTLCLAILGRSTAQDNTGLSKDFNLYTSNAYAASTTTNIEMNPFTGQINPSIPLYQKTMTDLGLRVSLSFQGGGGIKVDDPGSSVGRGWVLNCGGSIVRTVRGVPDDYLNAVPLLDGTTYITDNGVLFNGAVPMFTDGVQVVPGIDSIGAYFLGNGDSQHDIFEFSFCGRTGRFYLGRNGKVLIQDGSKLKIVPQFNASSLTGSQVTGFTVTDEQGIIYTFNQAEASENISSGPANNNTTFYKKPYASTWMLTLIQAPAGGEYIKFRYNIKGLTQPQNISDAYLRSRRTASADPGGASSVNSEGNIAEVETAPVYLHSVQFSEGTSLQFDYHLAVPLSDTVDNGNPSFWPLLQDMRILNNENQQIKEYLFNYVYYEKEPQDTALLRQHFLLYNQQQVYVPSGIDYRIYHLESIQEADAGGNVLPQYALTYYLDNIHCELALKGMNAEDYWGYYNGVNNTGNMLLGVSFGGHGPANRTPDVAYATIGALQSITLPTGGTESFQYELNDKWDSASNTTLTEGGIRLRQTVLFDGMDTANNLTTTYSYVRTNGHSSGFLGDTLVFHYLVNAYTQWPPANPNNPSVSYVDTVDVSDPANALSTIEGESAAYNRVVETQIKGGTTNGQIVHQYTDLSVANLWSSPNFYPYSPVERPLWAVGLPVSTSYYDAGGHLLKQVQNQYSIVQRYYLDTTFRSLYIAEAGTANSIQLWRLKTTYPLIGRADLTSTRETTYSSALNGEAVTAVKSTFFDTTYHFAREVQIYNSTGDSLQTYLYYPSDYTNAAGSFITQMISQNILNTPLESETWKNNSVLLHAKANQYEVLPNGLVRPMQTYISSNTAPLTITRSFNPATLLNPAYGMQADDLNAKYDSAGRLQTYEQRGNRYSTVIQDKSGNIIASARDAQDTLIAYTSFENNENNSHWAFAKASVVSGDAKTGVNAYNGFIGRNNLPAGNYRLRLWAKGSGNITVNGVNQAVTGAWQFYTWTLNGISAVNISSNGNEIDEVALYPIGSAMSTYTFQNGVGEASASDDNGNVNVYRYDSFNRNLTEQDRYGNILKSYAYKTPKYGNTQQSAVYTTYNCLNVSPGVDGAPVTYTVPAGKYISLVSQADANAKAVDDIFLNGQTYANQNGVCIAIYYNAAQSVTLTKSCSTGYVGTSVTYTVPAGKYSSTVSQAAADAQATADINANGQNYANTNGTCRQVVTITTRNPNGLTGYWVWLVNTVTGEQYDFAMPTAAQTTTIQVPTGTYNLTLTNPNGTANLHSFMAGCTGEGIDGTTLSNVSFYSGCSTVAIN